MAKVEILGVKIDNLSLQEVLEQINNFVQSKNKHFVVTPNPEFLVAAQKDKNFKAILNYADMAVADGVGLNFGAKLLGQRLQRLTGVDLVGYLCELAEQKKYSVFLLGGQNQVAAKCAQVLRENFPQLPIAGAEGGGEVIDNGKNTTDRQLIEKINQARPRILLVAFGQGQQEKWIFHNLDALASVRVAIGVGGAFDFIAGEIKRAPVWLQKIGLEWLYRLIQEPKRWRRIINAVIIFPALIIKEKIFSKSP